MPLTQITTSSIANGAVTTAKLAPDAVGPKITQIQITNSSGTVLDDTAISLSGGYIKITGTGFAAGAQVIVNNTPASSTTFTSSTVLNAQVGAQVAGTYIVYVVNTDGGVAIAINGLTYSSEPTWITGSSLSGTVSTPISIQLSATGATVYSLAAGSTLPAGLTLGSGGLLSGTVTGITSETVYNFTVNAIDAELQDSPRSFNITITAGDPFFNLTTLLLPGSATTFVRDASTNNFPVSVVGDTRPNTFNPYLTGWSNFFDGNRVINTGSSSELTLGTGDFTIEFFIYPLASTGVVINFTNGTSGQNLPFIGFDGSGFNYFYNGSNIVATSSVQTPVNSWTHVAMSRSAGTLRIFINGQLTASASDSTNITSTALTIGGLRLETSSWSSLINVFLSNLRIVKGTAVYTAAFTPPTAPLTAIAGTSILTCQSNRFRDASTNNLAITPSGNGLTVDSFSPFVEPATTNGSGYFDGTGDALTVPSNSNWAFTGQFTLEGWFYWNVASSAGTICGVQSAGGLGLYSSGSNVSPNVFGSGNIFNSTFNPVVGIWYHIAITRNSSNLMTMWVNGVSVGSATTSAAYTAGTYTINTTSNNNVLQGYISNFRIVNGSAVYTAAFTPPTSPLTAISGTNLLTLQNNQPTNNSMFLDSSSENFLITRNGNTTQGTFSPYSPSGWSNLFDGNGDFLRTQLNAVNIRTAFTIEAWVNLTTTAGFALFSASNTAGVDGSNLYLNIASGLVYLGDGIANNVSFSASLIPLNSWSHIAVTFDGTTYRVFVNGTSVGTSTTLLTNNTLNGIDIGGRTSSSLFTTGYISNFRVVKGTALYTANFTPPTQPLTAITGTSLLTCADNRFMDDSANNFGITRNGDVRVQNFSPFRAQTQTPNTYSGYFDGSGDYLSVPDSAAFDLAAGDWTIETWFNLPALPSTGGVYTFVSQWRSGGSPTLSWYAYLFNNAGTYQLYFSYSTTGTNQINLIVNLASAPSVGSWNHIAFVRSGNNFLIFLNGIQVGSTQTLNATIFNSTTPVWVGAQNANGAPDYQFSGCLSNLRIVKGTALYTANFTPATTPLTAVAGTSLLTCQSPTFVDNSTNSFPITVFGNSQPIQVNPFGFTVTGSTGYTAAQFGGSMYFDGNGDFLQTPVSNAFTFGTSAFTIEAWVNPLVNAASTTQWIYSNISTASGNTQVGLSILTNGTLQLQTWNTVIAVTSAVIPLNAWTHVAASFDGTTYRLFVNGVVSATSTTIYTLSTNGPGTVGHAGINGTSLFTGYISNVRIVKGIALYTSNFAPPIAPVQPVQNTTLLLNGTGAAITDATTKNDLETVGDARISTVQSKFSGSSMFFDGTGDRLIVPSSPNFDFSGNFTIEMWMNFTNVTSTWEAIISRAYAITGGWRLYKNDGTNQLSWWSVSSQVFSTTGSTLANNTWSHVAVVRNSGTITIYIDGINRGSAANTTNYNPGNYALEIGEGVVTSSFPFEGYMQDLRITNGVARYTTNFTPPTTAFLTQ